MAVTAVGAVAVAPVVFAAPGAPAPVGVPSRKFLDRIMGEGGKDEREAMRLWEGISPEARKGWAD